MIGFLDFSNGCWKINQVTESKKLGPGRPVFEQSSSLQFDHVRSVRIRNIKYINMKMYCDCNLEDYGTFLYCNNKL